jgi:hypothetical protein
MPLEPSFASFLEQYLPLFWTCSPVCEFYLTSFYPLPQAPKVQKSKEQKAKAAQAGGGMRKKVTSSYNWFCR